MSRVVVIGCGVVGAAIAYELSNVSGLTVTVLDKQAPAQGSTGAALGVLVAIISHKTKGKAWQLRQASMQRYETLIPELEAIIQRPIPFNRQGILMLCFEGENMEAWQQLVEIRQSQGWHLEIWDKAQLKSRCPQIDPEKMIGAVYSPQDRQVHPTALTHALIDAAQHHGVRFQFGVTVDAIKGGDRYQLQTSSGQIEADWVIISAGLGSTPLAASLAESVEIQPVLGQALHLRLDRVMGEPDFQPVITGNDVHIVPLGAGEYWVGATVEFPAGGEVVADAALLERVRQQAIAFCPSLAEATVLRTWSGLRPRPEGRPAPIIGHLPGDRQVLLATGHYRNGVLLAPATAQAIRDAILVTNP